MTDAIVILGKGWPSDAVATSVFVVVAGVIYQSIPPTKFRPLKKIYNLF